MGNAQRVTMQNMFAAGRWITTMDCASCGEVFGVDAETVAVRRRDGRGFFCPNGHSNVFSLSETLQGRELKDAKARAEAAERDAADQRRARQWAETRAKGANIAAGKAKAATKRLLHRVACGVCPHCQRTFKQLAAHMKTKHAGL